MSTAQINSDDMYAETYHARFISQWVTDDKAILSYRVGDKVVLYTVVVGQPILRHEVSV